MNSIDRFKSIGHKFYNSEQKILFLEFIEKKSNNYLDLYTHLFSKFKKFEEQFDKDICFFNEDEINTLLKEYLTRYSYDNNFKFDIIYRYIEWCETHNFITPFNSWENIKPTKYNRFQVIDEVYKRQMIKDPEDLQKKIRFCSFWA